VNKPVDASGIELNAKGHRMTVIDPGNPRRRLLIAAACAGLAQGFPLGALAQAYPANPLRIVHGFRPGGAVDITSRILAEGFTASLGQPVIVEGKPGAGGRLSAEYISKVAPNGYTLGMITGGDAVVAAYDEGLRYDLQKDFELIGLVATYPIVIGTAPNSPIASAKDMLRIIKQNPSKLSYATSGIGTTMHLTMELLSARVGGGMVHVPFRSDSLPDVVSGLVDLSVEASTIIPSRYATGQLRPLAVTSAKRLPSLPDTPTLGELVPSFELVTWVAMVGPKNMPEAATKVLRETLNAVVADPGYAKRIANIGIYPQTSTPEELRALMSGDIQRWRKVIHDNKLDLSKN
jgi:tripartite-type tricarboxylate transporter receptor subunit TctC